ncbi:MAG: hypothetical protein GX811_07525 [Lentisphaerae bacterium]|nr:hypothetical protein [Lentisphaerota bacterium]
MPIQGPTGSTCECLHPPIGGGLTLKRGTISAEVVMYGKAVCKIRLSTALPVSVD